jgi:hypothetical protein
MIAFFFPAALKKSLKLGFAIFGQYASSYFHTMIQAVILHNIVETAAGSGFRVFYAEDQPINPS